jgi:hypothetical protein
VLLHLRPAVAFARRKGLSPEKGLWLRPGVTHGGLWLPKNDRLKFLFEKHRSDVREMK